MAKADHSYKPDSSKQFGLALKRLLECKDLSQRQFAKLAGLTPDYVSKLVNGEIKEPRKSTVEKIAAGLGISERELWQQVKQVDEISEVETEEPGFSDGSHVDEPEEAASEPKEESQTPKKFVVGLDVLRTVPVWVGRDELLGQLQTEFVEASNEQRPVVLALIGQGGIGKTSLAVKLLEAVGVNVQQAELASRSVYTGVICWRAEEGTSFDEVASDLLSALGVESAEPVKEAGQKIQQIIKGLQQQRYLLLLDNLEVILHPASQPEAGRAVQPELGQLLNALVYRPHQSQVILTSREVPFDLADLRYPNSQPDPLLVRLERLGGVDVTAGAEILSQRQVTDSETDRRWVAERVEGHVFVLTQLAAVAKGKPGYLRQHPQLVTQRAEPILQEQLARQSEPARELLKRMCVLRRGADIRALTFVQQYCDEWEVDNRLAVAAAQQQPIDFSELEKQETQEIIEHLVNCSLVQETYDLSKCEVVYSLHQLITEFLWKRYSNTLPALFHRVHQFYQSSKITRILDSWRDVQALQEPLIFAFHLGDEQEATHLSMILIKSTIQLDQGTSLESVIRRQAASTENYDQASNLLGIAQIHYEMGYWDTAEQYVQEALALSIAQNNKSNIASALGQLGDIERNRGNWDAAERLFRQSLQLREELGDRSGMAATWASLGYIESCRGNWDAAEQLYRQSLQLREELGDRSGMATSWGVLGDIERNRGNWDAAEQLYRQSLQLREELGDRSGMASSWGQLGDIERNRGNWDAAEQLYQKSMQLSQELGSTWHLAHNNYDFAQLERQRGNLKKAQEYYNTAHQLFTQLGAVKDIERIEREWQGE